MKIDPQAGLLPLESASPHHRSSFVGWFYTIVFMKLHAPELLQYLATIITSLKLSRLQRLLSRFTSWFIIYQDKKPGGFPVEGPSSCDSSQGGGLKESANLGSFGQLSIKEEAAGKVRVFALVDIWTQSVLKPIHDYLFQILRHLPNDGTLDQRASVRRCFEKSKLANCSFGYDLSAATDRLPIEIQKSVLSSLLGEKVANA